MGPSALASTARTRKARRLLPVIGLLFAVLGCRGVTQGIDRAVDGDPHSFSEPQRVAVEHLVLELDVDFDARVLRGRATLHIANRVAARELVLDSWGLDVRRVTLDDDPRERPYEVGEVVEHLGSPLTIPIEPHTRVVAIEYETGPDALALQWLDPAQTAGGRRPFLLTQSEPVFARTWIPCQDSPAARATYAATLRVPRGLTALMSAENPTAPSSDGVYSFAMPYPIPSYLLALVVGEIEYRPLGPRSGVYAERPLVERAAWEFAETERMLEAAEALLGPYRWGRYDLIVLPPSFPYGGMENPRLTFVTPTLIAGDRSLVSTVAHEIAHSWSGNLVSAASWSDLWLNEGLTNYLERRIMEALHGPDHADMLAVIDGRLLEAALEKDGAGPDSHLRLDLEGRDPEEAFGDVAYEKGYLFFRMLEKALGREAWDRFLRGYFEEFAFQAMTTDRFLDYLRARTPAARTELEARLLLPQWIDGPGLPANRPAVGSAALDEVEKQLQTWLAGGSAAELETADWSTQHRLHFIRGLPDDLPAGRMAELDAEFGWTDSDNKIVLQAWLVQAARHGYSVADPAIERFLTGVGRKYLVEPLFAALAESPAGLERARRIYERARPGYHAVTRQAIERILAPPAGQVSRTADPETPVRAARAA